MKFGADGRRDERLGAAIVAIKAELIYVESARPAMDPVLPFYGHSVANSVRDFQEEVGLTVTGEVDWRTARELFRPRIARTAMQYQLQAADLGRQIQLESLFDPVAIGVRDPEDTGIGQINLRIHSTVTREQAFAPSFAIPWKADYIRDNHDRIAREAGVMRAARASYNIGAEYARRWMLDGFPESGLLIGEIDWYERATSYLAAIDRQTGW